MEPRAYYNEIEPYCAHWLHNLMRANLIMSGDIDTRPIQDVTPNDLRGYTQHHFFAGLGGWSYALRLAAWPDRREVWTGSCPCQPFSAAGKRGGFADERHLWPYWQYLIEQRRPAVVFGEQVASAADWLSLVRGDLEAMDYAVAAIPVEAASAGADHLRDRFWFVAHDEHTREGRRGILRPGESSPAAGERTSGQPAGSGFVDGSLANNGFGRRDGPRLPERGGDPGFQRQALGASQGQTAFSNGVGDMGYSGRAGAGRDGSSSARTQAAGESQRLADGNLRQPIIVADTAADFEWVIGADGKARRVKSRVRLLVDGFPNRIPILRAFGNAIDPRCAAKVIESVMDFL